MNASGTEAASDLIEEILDVEVETGTMAVIRKRPRRGDHPSVVMFHDGPGVRNATHAFAQKLASSGYDVAVPDLYHRHGRMIGYEPDEREADPSLVDQLRSMFALLDDGDIQSDLDATLAATRFDRRERLGVIGFCIGARAVARTMVRMPNVFVAGAMWHPSVLCDDTPDSPHLSAGSLSGGLFIGIGADDQQQPASSHQLFLDAIASLEDSDVQIYPGADHGYTWPGWPSYDAAAATDSFARTHALFQRYLADVG